MAYRAVVGGLGGDLDDVVEGQAGERPGGGDRCRRVRLVDREATLVPGGVDRVDETYGWASPACLLRGVSGLLGQAREVDVVARQVELGKVVHAWQPRPALRAGKRGDPQY